MAIGTLPNQPSAMQQPVEPPESEFNVAQRQNPNRQVAAMGSVPSTIPDGPNNNPYAGGTIPTVSDPDQTFADMTRQQYLDFVNNYGQFEEGLINQAQNDTSLIDQAREDVAGAQERARGIAQRNISRYGTSLTPAQRQEMERSLGRSNVLGGIQAIQDARLAQRDANQTLLADLINIGQGVNRTSLQQMGSAAADATARKNAYEQAKAQSRANTYGLIGSLGSAAILAAFGI